MRNQSSDTSNIYTVVEIELSNVMEITSWKSLKELGPWPEVLYPIGPFDHYQAVLLIEIPTSNLTRILTFCG
ncbi:hypothetical protein HanIR_Chr11g0552751 [Helianthus annuus]|nr:hypothetical protein HanIR_Chr11g0552751 [Helianthus annuus]